MNGTLRGVEPWASASAVRMPAEVLLLGGNEGAASGTNALLVVLLAAGLGALCGWGLRMRRRRIRAAALAEARRTLRRLIGTHTSALHTLHAIAADDEERARIEGAADSLVLVDHLVCSLSEETLSSSAGSPHVTWALPDLRQMAPTVDFRRN